MVFARIAQFQFKKGKFEDGFSDLDLTLNKLARNSKGFRGFVSLLSRDRKEMALILTLWEDEEALTASEKEVFLPTVEKMKDFLESAPVVGHYRVFSTEMFSRSAL